MAEPRSPKHRKNPRTPPAGRAARAAGGRSMSGGGASGTRTRTGATARRNGAAGGEALEAKELAPRSGAVREVLGMALYRAGRFQEALRELQAYRRLTGRLDQNHLIADSHRALGAPDKALEAARAALHARVPE